MTIPFDAPFVPDEDELRRTPTGWLPKRDDDAVTTLPDGSYDVAF